MIKPSTEEVPQEIVSLEAPTEVIEGAKDESLEEILDGRLKQTLAESPELRRVIDGALTGELPLGAELEVNQPRRLSPRAIQAIMLSIGSYYTKQEIAEITGLSYTYLTKLMRHPYARKIFVIASADAIDNLSLLERRLRRRSPKMLKIVKEIAEDETIEAPTRLRAAFGWLDRAGHSATQKTESKQTIEKRVTVTEKRSILIAEAIREAKGEIEDSPRPRILRAENEIRDAS